MLKLIKNETPLESVDGIITSFTLSGFISHIEDVISDGVALTTSEYTFLNNKVSLSVAPSVSLSVSFFMREEREIEGSGEVTMGDLIDEVYEEIGRKQYSNIYSKERIRSMLNKTLGRSEAEDATAYRLQTYGFKGLNGLVVSPDGNTVDLSVEATYPLDIEGSFLVEKGLYYNYYDYDGTTFTVSGDDLIDSYDKILIGHRIPYGVSKVSEVYINGIKHEYVDSRDFYLDSFGVFTIIKDYEGNSYLYLPFSKVEYTVVVKFVPDSTIRKFDEDVVDIPYAYTLVPVYEVSYRILASREDERWKFYKEELRELKRNLKGFKAKITNKQRGKIQLAPTYGDFDNNRIVQVLPSDIYDPYL